MSDRHVFTLNDALCCSCGGLAALHRYADVLNIECFNAPYHFVSTGFYADEHSAVADWNAQVLQSKAAPAKATRT